MNTKTVYQIDRAGMYQGETIADESPLEPGVWIMPGGTVEVAPPTDCPAEKWPRWNGTSWELSTKPQAANDNTALEKLQAFLAANPDVAELINQGGV